MTKELPIEIEMSFVGAIESAAQGWVDGVGTYGEFLETLNRMASNIYKAGQEDAKKAHERP